MPARTGISLRIADGAAQDMPVSPPWKIKSAEEPTGPTSTSEHGLLCPVLPATNFLLQNLHTKWACKSVEDTMVTWQCRVRMPLMTEFSQPDVKHVLLVAVLAWQLY